MQTASARPLHIKGRDLVNGVPKEISINQGQIAEALSEPVGTIVEGVRIALENTAPELAADICRPGHRAHRGRRVAARASTKYLRDETGLPVTVAEDPLTCVAHRHRPRARWKTRSSAACSRPADLAQVHAWRSPRERRPGWSRRAQYGLFATFVIATVANGHRRPCFMLILSLAASHRVYSAGRAAGAEIDAIAPVSGAFLERGRHDARATMLVQRCW